MIGKYTGYPQTTKSIFDEVRDIIRSVYAADACSTRKDVYLILSLVVQQRVFGVLSAIKNTLARQNRSCSIECRPIGIVHSPFLERKNTPNQGKNADALSTLEIYPEYSDGLLGLSEGDPVFILCWFDRAERDVLCVIPHGARRGLTGVFATRAPVRPNPISLTLVTIISIDETSIIVRGLEAINETPVLDIKPYYEGIDVPGVWCVMG
jgi:tRNA-Thr(GGU) m(6)t(6)A37 methyltransferase TsaA